MYSLYHVLSRQHHEEFAPVRCNEQTVMRLIGYFEDVVTENKLSALAVAGRCLDGDALRAPERVAKLAAASKHFYLFSCDPTCDNRTWTADRVANLTLVEESQQHLIESGPFLLVMESRFAGLLASCRIETEEPNHSRTYEMIWTFDPNVVFTAIEYLMARLNAQSPTDRLRFENVLNTCTPRTSSLRTALTFTTKLAMLMQRQNELETATNRIGAAISSTLELDQILQSAVQEVGQALNASRAAIVLRDPSGRTEMMEVYERGVNEATNPVQSAAEHGSGKLPGPLQMQITYRQSVIGELLVEENTPGRSWEPEERLMVNTVCDQLAVAVAHARLFNEVQTQALTDALTGLHNHRSFQDRLEREIRFSDRTNTPLSLILLDLDHLKKINDTHGHRSGDAALRYVARMMQQTVRDVDICARYGGEEFVVILPQCTGDDAIDVAERLREAIASTPVPIIGQVTASIGVASYPSAAKNKEELIEMADRGMYLAKASGRNRVRTPMHRSYANITNSVKPLLDAPMLD
jgi:diguanylate cyclase (GGDEF)-like protein